MPLLTELFILFGLNYKDVAPAALNAAFLGIQERSGQKLKREIQSQRLNETGCKPRRLLTIRQRRASADIPMKKCSYCGAEYPDDAIVCAVDHTPLPGMPSEADTINTVSIDEKHEPAFKTVELESNVPPDGEAALCISCLFPNLPDSHWCKRCGAPMSSMVGFLMPDAAQAVGFVFRRAVETPANFAVVCGIWLLYFPGFLLNALVLLRIFDSGIGGLPGLAHFWLAIACGAICASMLYRVTRNYLTMRSKRLHETAA